MKKRMMLAITLVISFAPAVLAAYPRADRVLQKEEVELVGEQPARIILSRMDGAVGCNLPINKRTYFAPSARENASHVGSRFSRLAR